MGQTNPASPRASKGKTPVVEAHSRPPDFPDLQMQGSTAWEPELNDPKARVRVYQARRPILDEGASARPDPWPSPDVIIINLAVCLGSAS